MERPKNFLFGLPLTPYDMLRQHLICNGGGHQKQSHLVMTLPSISMIHVKYLPPQINMDIWYLWTGFCLSKKSNFTRYPKFMINSTSTVRTNTFLSIQIALIMHGLVSQLVFPIFHVCNFLKQHPRV